MGRLKLVKQEKPLNPLAGMNGSRAHKVGPEEANRPEWTWKERGSKPMDSM